MGNDDTPSSSTLKFKEKLLLYGTGTRDQFLTMMSSSKQEVSKMHLLIFVELLLTSAPHLSCLLKLSRGM